MRAGFQAAWEFSRSRNGEGCENVGGFGGRPPLRIITIRFVPLWKVLAEIFRVWSVRFDSGEDGSWGTERVSGWE